MRFFYLEDEEVSPIRGGRNAAETALAQIDPAKYTRTRNFLDGAVTRLSPYLRHGVLTLAEVRDAALSRVSRLEDAEKFINELGWRDYWQRLYFALGEGVWKDREGYKTGSAASDYEKELPENLIAGTTGLNCMDSFSQELRQTGYLHNHARMWVAAYVVHWLRVRWQAGARWFLLHLLDGDPASNNLSWQWVASTFSNKPYFFNRENLERYTDGRYCRECKLRNRCPLDASYEQLEAELFHIGGDTKPPLPLPTVEIKPSPALAALSKPLIWIHTDSLNPQGEIFARYPDASACFVWDEAWLREEHISLKRVVFLDECLAEMPSRVKQRSGDLARELLSAADEVRADCIVAQRTPDVRLLSAAATVERKLPVHWIDPPHFVDDSRSYDLKRFSRYWQRAQGSAMKPTALRGEPE